jgi:hypothetical protein
MSGPSAGAGWQALTAGSPGAGQVALLWLGQSGFAGNPGEPGRLLEEVRRQGSELTVLVPARGRVVVVSGG